MSRLIALFGSYTQPFILATAVLASNALLLLYKAYLSNDLYEGNLFLVPYNLWAVLVNIGFVWVVLTIVIRSAQNKEHQWQSEREQLCTEKQTLAAELTSLQSAHQHLTEENKAQQTYLHQLQAQVRTSQSRYRSLIVAFLVKSNLIDVNG